MCSPVKVQRCDHETIDGRFRLYTQLDTSKTGDLAKSRQVDSESLKESGGRVDINSITAEEVLEQANKIFSPYTLKFAAPLSWFAVWKSKPLGR